MGERWYDGIWSEGSKEECILWWADHCIYHAIIRVWQKSRAVRSYDKDETIEGEVSRQKNIMDKRKEILENEMNCIFVLFCFVSIFLFV